MRQAVFVRPGLVEWHQAAEPRLQGAGEAIVRPLVVGRCDLDVAYMRGLLPMGSGEPIGHEVIGAVVEVGDEVRLFAPGDIVFVSAQIGCGACAPCLSGRSGRCACVPLGASYGMGREGDFGGALADLMRVPFADAMLAPVPVGADPVRLIGLADMVADAWRGVGPHLQRMPGGRVLVLGGLPPVIGLYAVGLATAFGAGLVDYVDGDTERCGIAEFYGARLRAMGETAGGAYDVVFVADARRIALEAAFAAAAPGGVVTSATPPLDGMPEVDCADLYHRGLTWTVGRPDCAPAHRGAVEAWAHRGFDPDHVPTTRVDWDEAAQAWASDAMYLAAVRT